MPPQSSTETLPTELRPAEWLIRNAVTPNRFLLTVLAIVFQVAIATAILSRGDWVTAGLVAGGTFPLIVAFFSNPAGTVAALAFALVQFGLAVTR